MNNDSADFFTVFIVGCFVLGALKTLIPVVIQLADSLIVWLVRRPAARARQWRTLNPIEQNLQRASHGAAYVVLPLAAVWLVGPDAVGFFLSRFAPAVRLLMIGACALWFVVAVGRCVGGWRRSAGIRDGFLATRAFFKLAAGSALLVLLHHPPAGWDVPDRGAPALALLLVPLWLVVTGSVRFAILVRPAGRALPPVEDDIAANEFDWNR